MRGEAGVVKGNRLFLEEVDRFLHEPSRSVILAVLSAVDEADFRYLENETGLTKGNLSVHLSKLEEARYLEIEKTYRGKIPLTVCRITPEGRHAFEKYRRVLQQFVEENKTSVE
jgi:DNA-binding MarR family transcriptional regulator